ncbi:hypothetical protein J7L27_03950 [Candidatus Bathyarchaeota archaeon]|nr:hypothetical protein [Candidatus Bathyarchaeota archaeon]
MEQKDKKSLFSFLTAFFIYGFLTKLISETLHEVGHGIFVMAFGGKVLKIFISVLWPLQRSWIRWRLPENIGSWELSLIYAGGILTCLVVSFSLQAYLHLKKNPWIISLPLAWLSFWCFLNGVGYLILGGLVSYGDIRELIKLGCLTNISSIVIGLILFAIGFPSLSKIFFNVFSGKFSKRGSMIASMLFWMQIPVYCFIFLLSL